MQQATHLLKLWDKEKKCFIEHRCYFQPQEYGLDSINDCDTDNCLGFFDPDKNIYSFEKELIGFSIRKISIKERLSDLLKEMKNRLRNPPEGKKPDQSVQKSGQEKETTTLF